MPPARQVTPEQTNPFTSVCYSCIKTASLTPMLTFLCSVRRVGGPTIEEQQESDRAYVESEPIRTSPPRPLRRQAKIYVASTSSSASPPKVKKPIEDEIELVGYNLRKKRARDEESDDEDARNDSFEDLRKKKKVKFTEASDEKGTPAFSSQTTRRAMRPRRH